VPEQPLHPKALVQYGQGNAVGRTDRSRGPGYQETLLSDRLHVEPLTLETTRSVPGNGSEVFFPKPDYQAVYEITITGVLEYRFFHLAFWSGDRVEDDLPQKSDAFYTANKAGRFEAPHQRLLVNGKPLDWWDSDRYSSYRKVEKLEAERGPHKYRFLIDDPGECVGIAFQQHSGWPQGWQQNHIEAETDDHLTAIVRALPAGTPTLAERRQKAKKPPVDAHPAPQPAPRLTPDEVRERELHWDEVRAKDFHARLMAIARREQEALAAIDQMQGIMEENKENYRQEARDFAAGEIARLSATRKEGAFNAKTI
jgi:hypothetical protein